MKKVILEESKDVLIELLRICEPIFVKKNDKLCGMIIKAQFGKWLLALGGDVTSSFVGPHDTRESCIKDGSRFGYEFFIED